MRIQELERLVGSDRATIRFYEKEGLITPVRSENGYRDYTEENAEELKKIRLLRQLGLSVFTIKQLQQGSADFSEALADQVKRLSDQIEESKRAKAVCQTMRDDGAKYESLDTAHYQNLLRQVRTDVPGTDFQEDIPREIHPWRRWFARTLDYWWISILINFVIVVLLRVRPLPNDFADILIGILSGALLVPIEAFLLHKFGTTPGKFTMAIRLESANGGKLTLDAALRRSWRVYKEGMCFRIPIVQLLIQWYQYLRLTGRSIYRFARKEDIPDPEDMRWDDETEIIYTRMTGKRGLILAVLILFILSIGAITGSDSIRPKYRGSELTITQFAENYNHCIRIMNENAETYDMLQSDGTKYPVPETSFVVDMTTGEALIPQEFEYMTESGILRSVSIHRSWDDVFYAIPMNGEAAYIAFTMVLSQDGCGFKDLMNIAKLMDQNITQNEGEIIYRDIIQIRWQIDAENCTQSIDGIYFTDDDAKPSSLDFVFTVTIL